MRIYTDHNGLAVNAITTTSDGQDVEGHLYHVLTGSTLHEVRFQNGPVPQFGVNGITNEALLAIVIHRTEFLDSEFPCDENKSALEHLRAALKAFEDRTSNRISRGVEGQNVV